MVWHLVEGLKMAFTRQTVQEARADRLAEQAQRQRTEAHDAIDELMNELTRTGRGKKENGSPNDC